MLQIIDQSILKVLVPDQSIPLKHDITILRGSCGEKKEEKKESFGACAQIVRGSLRRTCAFREILLPTLMSISIKDIDPHCQLLEPTIS